MGGRGRARCSSHQNTPLTKTNPSYIYQNVDPNTIRVPHRINKNQPVKNLKKKHSFHQVLNFQLSVSLSFSDSCPFRCRPRMQPAERPRPAMRALPPTPLSLLSLRLPVAVLDSGHLSITAGVFFSFSVFSVPDSPDGSSLGVSSTAMLCLSRCSSFTTPRVVSLVLVDGSSCRSSKRSCSRVLSGTFSLALGSRGESISNPVLDGLLLVRREGQRL